MKSVKFLEARVSVKQGRKILFTKGAKYTLFITNKNGVGSVLTVKDNYGGDVQLSENDVVKYFIY